MAAITSKPFTQEETDRLRRVYQTVLEKGQTFIRTIPGYATLPLAFEKFQHRIKNWQVRKDDVYILTFAKNGTTWTQELVWLLQNDCNFEEAKATHLEKRFPFLDRPILQDYFKKELPQLKTTSYFNMQADYLKTVEEMPSPRLIQTHIRLCLLPDDLLDQSKSVVCLRNPKDTVVSYYHHEKLMKSHGYTGDFPTYFDLFMDNLVIYSSYFEYVKEVWRERNHPNVCLLFFEEMKRDLTPSVKKVARFLGKNLSDDMVEKLVNHLSFKQMKDNPAVNKEASRKLGLFTEEGHFMRKGEIGDWKNYFTDDMNKRMDEAIEKHFNPIGLKFQYE